MHGTTGFLVIMPLSAAFLISLCPFKLVHGCRLSQNEHLKSLVFYRRRNHSQSSWFFTGGSPAIGWFGYAPLTDPRFTEVIGDMGPDFWIFSLQILGIASS